MLPYQAALSKLQSYIDTYSSSLYGPRMELSEATRVRLRERRDYWHAIGSRIRRRMEREQRRRATHV